MDGDKAMPLTPESDIDGPYLGRGNVDEWGVKHADILTRLMQAEFAIIPEAYDRACHLSLPGGRDVHGWKQADAFWLGLRSALPSAAFKIDHRMGRSDPMLPPRSAIRWSLTGQHDGWGAFGAPTGAMVHVMGVSHVEFGPRGIRRETTLFDEIAIWKQILLQNES